MYVHVCVGVYMCVNTLDLMDIKAYQDLKFVFGSNPLGVTFKTLEPILQNLR